MRRTSKAMEWQRGTQGIAPARRSRYRRARDEAGLVALRFSRALVCALIAARSGGADMVRRPPMQPPSTAPRRSTTAAMARGSTRCARSTRSPAIRASASHRIPWTPGAAALRGAVEARRCSQPRRSPRGSGAGALGVHKATSRGPSCWFSTPQWARDPVDRTTAMSRSGGPDGARELWFARIPRWATSLVTPQSSATSTSVLGSGWPDGHAAGRMCRGRSTVKVHPMPGRSTTRSSPPLDSIPR
jgi:hypothetical protein